MIFPPEGAGSHPKSESISDQWGEFAREMYTGSEVRGGWRSTSDLRGLQSESPRDGSGGQVRGWGLVDNLLGASCSVRARVCALRPAGFLIIESCC